MTETTTTKKTWSRKSDKKEKLGKTIVRLMAESDSVTLEEIEAVRKFLNTKTTDRLFNQLAIEKNFIEVGNTLNVPEKFISVYKLHGFALLTYTLIVGSCNESKKYGTCNIEAKDIMNLLQTSKTNAVAVVGKLVEKNLINVKWDESINKARITLNQPYDMLCFSKYSK